MAGDLNIFLLTPQLDTSNKVVPDLNKQIQILAKKLDKIKLNIEFNSSELKTFTDQISSIQKTFNQLTSANNTKGIKLIDESSINKNVKIVKDLNDAIKQFGKDGNVTVTNKIFTDSTKQELKSFQLQIAKLNGDVEKLKFNLVNLHPSGEKGFRLDSIAQTTKTVSEHQLKLFQAQAQINATNFRKKFGYEENDILEKYLETVKKLTTETPNLRQEMDKLSYLFKQIQANAHSATTNTLNFAEALRTGLFKVAVWGIATSAIYDTINALLQIAQTVVEVDKNFTEMQKVLSVQTDWNNLMQESIQIANQYGRTITDVQQSVIEFGKQGMEAAEALQMANATMLMSNVTGLKASEAAEKLGSALIQFNLSGKESISVVDAINEVDNNFAVTSQGLVQSISKAGEAAQQFGVSLNELLGITTAIQTATRESGNIIGNMEKSVFARLNMEKTQNDLAKIGVAVKDLNGELRPATQIYADVAAKWQDMSRAEKTWLAESLAGKYHITRMMALLDNWQIMVKATETAEKSYGSAIEENARHMQSLEAKITKLSASWQELSVAVGEAGLESVMRGTLNILTNFTKGFTELVETGGLWKIALVALVGAITAVTVGLVTGIPVLATFTGAIVTATRAVTGLTLAMMKNPWILLATGVAIAITSLITYEGKLKEIKEEQERLSKTADEAAESIKKIEESIKIVGGTTKEQVNTYEGMINTIDKLKKKFDDYAEAQLKARQDEEARKSHVGWGPLNLPVNKVNMGDIAVDLQEIPQEIKDYAASLGIAIKQGESFESIQKRINDELNKLKGNLDKLKENDLGSQYEKTGKKIETVNQLINDHNNGIKISAERIKKASETVPELTDAITYENGVLVVHWERLNDVNAKIKEQGQVAIEVARSKIATKKNELAEMLKLYNIEIDIMQKTKEEALSIVRAQVLATSFDSNDQGFGPALDYRVSKITDAMQEIKQSEINLAEFEERIKNAGKLDYSGGGSSGSKSSRQIDKYQTEAYEEAIRNLDNAQKASEYTQSRLNKTTAEYRAELQTQIDLLRQKQDLANQEANRLRAVNAELEQQLANMGDWNALSADGKEKWNNLAKELDDNKKKIVDLGQSWLDWDNQIRQLNFDVVEDKISFINKELELQKTKLDEAKEAWQELDKYAPDYTTKLNEAITQATNLIQAYSLEVQQIETEINSEKWSGEQLEKLNQELKQAKDGLIAVKRELKSFRESIANDVIEVYKSVYEEQKRVALDAIDDQIDAEEKRHNKRIKNIEDESDAFEEAINRQMELLDRQADTEDYNTELSKLQKESLEIQENIDALALDNSLEAQAKLRELQKQKTEKDEEIERLKTERDRKLRKDNLQDQLDAYKKDIDAKKEAEDEKYEKTKENLEKQKEDIQNHYEGLINDEKRWSEIRRNIMAGNLESIKNDFASMASWVSANAIALGQTIHDNLTNELQRVNQELTSLPDSFGSGNDDFTDKIQQSNEVVINTAGLENINGRFIMKATDLASRLGETVDWDENTWEVIIGGKRFTPQKIVNDRAYVGIREVAEALGKTVKWDEENQRIRIFHDGGYTGNMPTRDSRLISLLSKLKPNELPAILKNNEHVLPDWGIKNIASNIRAMISGINIQVPSPAFAGVSGGNIYVTIENMNANKPEDVNKFFNIIGKEMKKRGKV